MANFSNMPPELRNAIYSQLHETRSRWPLQPTNNKLALVSKQLHEESTSHLYEHINTAVEVPAQATDTATILPPIADRYLRFLRRLTVYTTTGDPMSQGVRKVASIIASIATIGASFEQLQIHISSPLSKLLSFRVDDSIMGADHPITVALSRSLGCGVAKTTSIELKNTWFAPGVAQTLLDRYHARLQFLTVDGPVQDAQKLERPLTGSYLRRHLTALDLDDEAIADAHSTNSSSTRSTPTSLSSSLCSAFEDLDTFSVTTFELSSDDDDVAENGESADESREDEEPFFAGIDIEELEASTQQPLAEDFDDVEVDEDEEMDEVPEEEVDAIMSNMEQAAHHVANEADVTFLTNFAPDLLLTRHNLGHLV
ncbi:hypothetical protein BDW02DRAFT_424820 [Decorospora gaudefroyi]|uniref:Uncharacterized protein n=1 Tax=Decorospora gaudefroyi TaxID=184978 RepID=A0A6A5K4D2_9PLEO|nr:hypothetical protein BDW02DRAFT_41790 [Decorospora gaudefroyi]KAF1832522.1 hypothetical protein BDW02DRAFT_424820 [Decorospora gaudefroyi]